LREGCRIAVVANDAIGNFVMATPLLQLLRLERNPSEIHFFGGTRTRELQEASDLMNGSHLLHGIESEGFLSLVERHRDRFDLIVNLESTPYSKTFVGLIATDNALVCGPCMGGGGRGELPFSQDARGDLWRDKQWVAKDLTSKYPFLRSGFISEIFARLCYLDGDLPTYRVPCKQPDREIPDLLIATAASLEDKLWAPEGWRDSLSRARQAGMRAGLLGAPPSQQADLWKGAAVEDELVSGGLVEDMRGTLTMPQVVGALGRCRALLTLDNGILHLGVAAGAKTIGLYRHGIHRLWAPPSERLTVLTPGEHKPVTSIEPEGVWEALQVALG
jgi:ADP-heptose:LPS heptosyltransferase